jgi:hypothetical protein
MPWWNGPSKSSHQGKPRRRKSSRTCSKAQNCRHVAGRLRGQDSKHTHRLGCAASVAQLSLSIPAQRTSPNHVPRVYHGVPNPVQGTSFCQSDGVSFEAGTEFTVGLVHFVVTGANGVAMYNRTIAEAPYYFNGENALGPKGVTFPLGTYTMKITADYDPLHFKSFVFTVIDC